MPRPLRRGILGVSTIIISKDIDKYAFMCDLNFYESDVKWKSKYQFECHIAATKQQRTLNFELLVSNFSCLQLIQTSVPSVARRHQCDIRIGSYFKCCYKYIILISWNLIWMAKLKFKSLALNTAIVGLWIFHLSLPIHQNVFHPVLGKIFHDLGWYFPAVAGCNFRYFPIYFWVLHR